MDRISYDLKELFIHTLPDGIVAVLSDYSQDFNNLVYYDLESLQKIQRFQTMDIISNLRDLYKFGQIGGPSSLRDLSLVQSEIDDDEAQLVSIVIAKLPFLQELYLDDNQIGDEGAKAVATSIADLHSLKILDLSENQIGDEGAKAVATSITNLRSLQELHLGNNHIGNKGAQAIATAITGLPSLNILCLGNNQIGDEGAQAIATAIAHPLFLIIPDFIWNRIINTSVYAIIKTIANLPSLEILTLGGNPIREETKCRLRSVRIIV